MVVMFTFVSIIIMFTFVIIIMLTIVISMTESSLIRLVVTPRGEKFVEIVRNLIKSKSRVKLCGSTGPSHSPFLGTCIASHMFTARYYYVLATASHFVISEIFITSGYMIHLLLPEITQCKWRHLVAKFGTNASGAILWTILQLMQIAPPGDQNWNQC